MLLLTLRIATVCQGMKAIHLLAAKKYLKSMTRKIHVIQPLAEKMRSAQFTIMQQNAHAFHHIEVIPIQQDVDQNAFLTLIVHRTFLVLTNTVEILAPVFVEQMPNVLLQTTFRFVAARVASMAIHSVDAEKKNQFTFHQNQQTHVSHHPADQIHCAELSMEDLLAHA